MATGQNPSVEVQPAADHPPPVTQSGEKWTLRSFQAAKTATNTATGGITFTPADFGLTGREFYVDKVSVWKLTQTGGPGLQCFFYNNNVTDLGDTVVKASDYGTATSLAGMTFKVPLGHAKVVGSNDGVSIVDVNPALGKGLDSYVSNLHCWVNY